MSLPGFILIVLSFVFWRIFRFSQGYKTMLEEGTLISGNNSEHLLTPKELSEWLRVTPGTIYKWTHYGFIPHIKLGKSIRFDRLQVERWCRRRQKRGRDRLPLDCPEL